ncbi:MAG: pantoate--beta-alanine ligase [bacterium]|jgi:glycerol-3-phosphate cytidylyltransferase
MTKRIGFVASAFDLLHAGHVLMLKDARSQCDYLIAGLHVNPNIERSSKNSPIQSLYERTVQLEGCKYIDEIVVYETEDELVDILKTKNINLRILGSEYENTKFTGYELDMNLYFHNRNHSYSSSELRKRINIMYEQQ